MVKLALASLAALAAAGIASAAIALPLSPSAPAQSISLAEPIHGCHHGVMRDRRGTGVYGWHFHDRACIAHEAPPPGYADTRGRRLQAEDWHVPVCRYRCTFVGPTKQCRQVCR